MCEPQRKRTQKSSVTLRVGVANLSNQVKPEPGAKKRSKATSGRLGVEGGSAHRKNGQELGIPIGAKYSLEESITTGRRQGESDRSIVAKKPAKASGAKGP